MCFLLKQCRPLLAVLAAFSLAACVSAPKQVAANRDDTAALRHVQVLPIRHSELDLVILNNPGASFGLIGATIAEANRVSKRNKMRAHFEKVQLDHVAKLQQALTSQMAERGITLHWPEPVMAAKKERGVKREPYGLRKHYDAAGDGMDAILDVNFGFVGYAAAGAGKSAPYRPTVVLSARLVSADGRENLMTDYFIHNNAFNDAKAVVVEPDDRHVYPDFDDLDAAGPAAADGLTVAIEKTVAALKGQM